MAVNVRCLANAVRRAIRYEDENAGVWPRLCIEHVMVHEMVIHSRTPNELAQNEDAIQIAVLICGLMDTPPECMQDHLKEWADDIIDNGGSMACTMYKRAICSEIGGEEVSDHECNNISNSCEGSN